LLSIITFAPSFCEEGGVHNERKNPLLTKRINSAGRVAFRDAKQGELMNGNN